MSSDPFNPFKRRGLLESEKAIRKIARQQEVEDIRWLMNSESGRRIVWHLLEACGLRRLSYTGTHETFFREGQRSVGLQLLTLISTHCPERLAELWSLRLKENGDLI